MSLARCGLALNFVGALLAGLTNQFGAAAGYGGGPLGWRHPASAWQLINAVGWFMLVVGFGLQYRAARQGTR